MAEMCLRVCVGLSAVTTFHVEREEWGRRGGACLGTFWAEKKKWVNKFDGGRRNGMTFSALAHLRAAVAAFSTSKQSLIQSYLQLNTECIFLADCHTLITPTESSCLSFTPRIAKKPKYCNKNLVMTTYKKTN